MITLPLGFAVVVIYPRRLTANQRAVAARYLASIASERRQSVLDELEGRLRAEQRDAACVYDELRYLHQLCAQVNAGGFQPNLGLKVQDERERSAQDARKRRQEAPRTRQIKAVGVGSARGIPRVRVRLPKRLASWGCRPALAGRPAIREAEGRMFRRLFHWNNSRTVRRRTHAERPNRERRARQGGI